MGNDSAKNIGSTDGACYHERTMKTQFSLSTAILQRLPLIGAFLPAITFAGTPAPPLANDVYDIDGNVKTCAVDDDCKAGEAGPDPQTVCRDADGDAIPDACYVMRNRYLSIKPNPINAGINYAIRISLDTGVAGEAELGYVAQPEQRTTNGPGPNEFDVARLQDTPYFQDWNNVPSGVISVGDCEISPGHNYHVQTIAEGGIEFSTVLILPTAPYGDVSGIGTGPPDGVASLSDALSAVLGFQVQQLQPIDRLDIEPTDGNAIPNLIVNLADIKHPIFAWQGRDYLGDEPLDCP